MKALCITMTFFFLACNLVSDYPLYAVAAFCWACLPLITNKSWYTLHHH